MINKLSAAKSRRRLIYIAQRGLTMTMTHTANRATHANTHDRVVVINDQAMKNCSKTMKGKHTLLNRKHVAQYIFYDISLLWYLWICTHVLWLPIKEFYGIYPYSGAASTRAIHIDTHSAYTITHILYITYHYYTHTRRRPDIDVMTTSNLSTPAYYPVPDLHAQ